MPNVTIYPAARVPGRARRDRRAERQAALMGRAGMAMQLPPGGAFGYCEPACTAKQFCCADGTCVGAWRDCEDSGFMRNPRHANPKLGCSGKGDNGSNDILDCKDPSTKCACMSCSYDWGGGQHEVCKWISKDPEVLPDVQRPGVLTAPMPTRGKKSGMQTFPSPPKFHSYPSSKITPGGMGLYHGVSPNPKEKSNLFGPCAVHNKYPFGQVDPNCYNVPFPNTFGLACYCPPTGGGGGGGSQPSAGPKDITAEPTWVRKIPGCASGYETWCQDCVDAGGSITLAGNCAFNSGQVILKPDSPPGAPPSSGSLTAPKKRLAKRRRLGSGSKARRMLKAAMTPRGCATHPGKLDCGENQSPSYIEAWNRWCCARSPGTYR